jgi:hypothetical protein
MDLKSGWNGKKPPAAQAILRTNVRDQEAKKARTQTKTHNILNLTIACMNYICIICLDFPSTPLPKSWPSR